jgi:hypothetical protein
MRDMCTSTTEPEGPVRITNIELDGDPCQKDWTEFFGGEALTCAQRVEPIDVSEVIREGPERPVVKLGYSTEAVTGESDDDMGPQISIFLSLTFDAKS